MVPALGTEAHPPGSLTLGRQHGRRWIFVGCILLAVAGVIACGIVVEPKDYWPTVVACSLGALLAVAELVARYRDDPAAAVLSWPAAVYVGVNAAAAGVALYLIRVFGWTFGANGSAREAVQVLTAGFGSAALFRSSVFNVTAGDRVIGIGPSEILNVILTAADRAVDRERALIRATRAAEIMQGLKFEGNSEAILAYCVATMQNVSPEEARAVEAKISALRNDPKNNAINDKIKSYILGLSLLTLVGDNVLTKATDQLKKVLREEISPPTRGDPVESAIPSSKKDKMLRVLRDEGGVMSLDELRKRVGLELEESYLIDDLQSRGLVKLQRGEEGNETIQITNTN
jgi:hypothetical protein